MADIFNILVRCVIMVPFIVILTRIAGLRSFSKMSGFDFAVTVASGSVLAATVMTPSTPISHGMAALIGLFIVQMVIARARAYAQQVPGLVDNDPLLVMRDGEFLMENIKKSGMTKADVIGKLRESNALEFSKVRAVIFEPTGDISVLHGDTFDDTLLEGVRDSV
ncbi:Protein of unknown function [Loktanella sp. DSM 29012]|uniref:DUF421 domain-containing protein n=1 Tax=Loktanella gaetbuli TaxID=2881335 RepID=A0ABS8BT35_9RHOB|nr:MULTISPECIES: YetF domain-containing protein [Loktanella]MCB5198904.1 DUF421 domain-containing protein [Loktanella gaetbuli]SEP70063.1 Protein of unknown function [Loktanella sp. DSM 29012]